MRPQLFCTSHGLVPRGGRQLVIAALCHINSANVASARRALY